MSLLRSRRACRYPLQIRNSPGYDEVAVRSTNPVSGVVMRWTMLLGVLLVPQAPPPRLTGDWQARTGGGDEIRHVMVRPDSSAQFGRDLARWRVVGDSLWITLGDGVWQVYG